MGDATPGRRALLAAAALALPAAAHPPSGLWFDPTQLPSYTGRLERWVSNPAGEIDRGLFREGAQFVFPPTEAEALLAAIERGGTLAVWGIRARAAPVITMLAWAPTDADPASFVERPAWFQNTSGGSKPLTVTGKVLAPLLTPQGEPMGVILTEGGAVRLPVAIHKQLGDRLKPGEPLCAAGQGEPRGELVAIDAERIGRDAASLEPLPAPKP